MRLMTKRWIVLVAAVLFLAGVAVYSYQRGGDPMATREAMLTLMPGDSCAVVYIDVAEIRSSAFAAVLYKWAPQPHIDPEYTRFLQDTGFDYERDLDRVAIAFLKHSDEVTIYSVADGRFDQKKIEAYLSRTGAPIQQDERDLSKLPISSQKLSFGFLRSDRIALTNDPRLSAAPAQTANREDAREWRERFERLAGSPLFAVLRQEAFAGNSLAAHAPGELQSPQLASLLNQLLWVTIAGKPEGESLRLVAEGEYADDRTARQLQDVLNGILLLAQGGLNSPDTRRELDPQMRDAYLRILRGADVARIDRGETKSVRAIIQVTPQLLEVARAFVPVMPASDPIPSNSSVIAGSQAQVVHPKRSRKRLLHAGR
jgi:hypothetical protein